MYLKISSQPKYSTEVRDLQLKLNAIRVNTHGNWPALIPDGLFGKQTETAIRGFQSYRNITPISGEIGDTTMRYINEAYNRVPKIKSADNNLSHHPISTVKKDYSLVKRITDEFMGFITNIDELIKGEVEYALKLGKCTPQASFNHMRSSIGKLDPKMNKLKQLFLENMESRKLVAQYDTLSRAPIHNTQGFIEQNKIRTASKIKSLNQTKAKVSAKQASEISKMYIAELQKYNIANKIGNQLKRYGITGEMKISQLKNIKIKAGGIFLIYSLKDIIWDLVQFDQWGQEQWKSNLLKHCYEFLDQMIIGIIASVIAAAVVAAVVAVIGVTVSAGILAIIIAVVAIIIGLIIGWIINILGGEDFSFTKFAWEGSAAKIIETVYNIK